MFHYILDIRWFQEEEKSHILFIVFMTYYAATICLQLNHPFEGMTISFLTIRMKQFVNEFYIKSLNELLIFNAILAIRRKLKVHN